MYRSLLCEEEIRSVKWKVSIYLIGTYLMISLYAVLSAGIHESCCSYDICLKEYLWVLYGSVHMRFSSEVHYHIWMFIFEQLIYALSITYIKLHESEVWIVHNRFKG